MKRSRLLAFLLTLVLALLAGAFFSAIGMVIPWLLGPLLVIIIIKTALTERVPLYWPDQLRSFGLLLIGIQLGASVTSEAARQMMANLPYMIVTTLLLIGFSLMLAYVVAKITGIDSSTALLGSFPGGLSQMVIVGEEMERANEAIIAFMQTLRILLVIISVPLSAKLIYGDAGSTTAVLPSSASGFSIEIELLLLLFVLAPIGIWLGKKIHLPIPFMLVPLLIVAMSQITIVPGTTVELPNWLINGAQICLGTHLGYSMKINRTFFTFRMVSAALGSNLVLLAFCFGLSEIFSVIWNTPFKDIFLAAAPGGIAEMSITALSIQADAAFVTSFLLFRVLFILLVVTPVMKWVLLRKEVSRVKESV